MAVVRRVATLPAVVLSAVLLAFATGASAADTAWNPWDSATPSSGNGGYSRFLRPGYAFSSGTKPHNRFMDMAGSVLSGGSSLLSSYRQSLNRFAAEAARQKALKEQQEASRAAAAQQEAAREAARVAAAQQQETTHAAAEQEVASQVSATARDQQPAGVGGSSERQVAGSSSSPHSGSAALAAFHRLIEERKRDRGHPASQQPAANFVQGPSGPQFAPFELPGQHTEVATVGNASPALFEVPAPKQAVVGDSRMQLPVSPTAAASAFAPFELPVKHADTVVMPPAKLHDLWDAQVPPAAVSAFKVPPSPASAGSPFAPFELPAQHAAMPAIDGAAPPFHAIEMPSPKPNNLWAKPTASEMHSSFGVPPTSTLLKLATETKISLAPTPPVPSKPRDLWAASPSAQAFPALEVPATAKTEVQLSAPLGSSVASSMPASMPPPVLQNKKIDLWEPPVASHVPPAVAAPVASFAVSMPDMPQVRSVVPPVAPSSQTFFSSVASTVLPAMTAQATPVSQPALAQPFTSIVPSVGASAPAVPPQLPEFHEPASFVTPVAAKLTGKSDSKITSDLIISRLQDVQRKLAADRSNRITSPTESLVAAGTATRFALTGARVSTQVAAVPAVAVPVAAVPAVPVPPPPVVTNERQLQLEHPAPSTPLMKPLLHDLWAEPAPAVASPVTPTMAANDALVVATPAKVTATGAAETVPVTVAAAELAEAVKRAPPPFPPSPLKVAASPKEPAASKRPPIATPNMAFDDFERMPEAAQRKLFKELQKRRVAAVAPNASSIAPVVVPAEPAPVVAVARPLVPLHVPLLDFPVKKRTHDSLWDPKFVDSLGTSTTTANPPAAKRSKHPTKTSKTHAPKTGVAAGASSPVKLARAHVPTSSRRSVKSPPKVVPAKSAKPSSKATPVAKKRSLPQVPPPQQEADVGEEGLAADDGGAVVAQDVQPIAAAATTAAAEDDASSRAMESTNAGDADGSGDEEMIRNLDSQVNQFEEQQHHSVAESSDVEQGDSDNSKDIPNTADEAADTNGDAPQPRLRGANAKSDSQETSAESDDAVAMAAAGDAETASEGGADSGEAVAQDGAADSEPATQSDYVNQAPADFYPSNADSYSQEEVPDSSEYPSPADDSDQ